MAINTSDVDLEENDNVLPERYSKFLEETANNEKNSLALQFAKKGEMFLNEIERKKNANEMKKSKLISYIIKHSKLVMYNINELKSYSLEDVLEIYNTVKKENRWAITKIICFIFGIE